MCHVFFCSIRTGKEVSVAGSTFLCTLPFYVPYVPYLSMYLALALLHVQSPWVAVPNEWNAGLRTLGEGNTP